LRDVYIAATVEAAEDAFLEFAYTWEHKHPAMVDMWKRSWTEFVPSWTTHPRSAN